MEQKIVSFEDLPFHLLQDILMSAGISGRDLACLESSSYVFRKPVDAARNRVSSIAEETAYHLCKRKDILKDLSENKWREIWKSMGCSWKKVLDFLQKMECASGTQPFGAKFKQVNAGTYSTLVVSEEGTLWSTGSTFRGWHLEEQNQEFISCVPTLVSLPAIVKVAQVSAGHLHVTLLSTLGQVYTYGVASSGCLGNDIEETQALIKPTLVETLRDTCCKQVAAGARHNLALSFSGEVFSWGRGKSGCLGHGDEADKALPTQVSSLKELGRICHMAAGAGHNLLVSSAGIVFSFGCGDNGRLGHGSSATQRLPLAVASFTTMGVFIVKVFADEEHSATIDFCGKVYTWGRGYCGALGHGGSSEDDVMVPQKVRALDSIHAVQVTMKKRKTMVLDVTGKVFGFGWMAGSGLQIVSSENQAKVFVPRPLPIFDSVQVAQISTGWYHTVALTRNGEVLGVGDNNCGQIGQGNSDEPRASLSNLFYEAPAAATMAL